MVNHYFFSQNGHVSFIYLVLECILNNVIIVIIQLFGQSYLESRKIQETYSSSMIGIALGTNAIEFLIKQSFSSKKIRKSHNILIAKIE